METFKQHITPRMKNKVDYKVKDNPSDKVYTKENIARFIIQNIDNKFSIYGKVLEPCRGKGAFYNNFSLVKGKIELDYCEIDEGKDFFDYKEKVDWIITNPPYSVYDEFLDHCFEIADNIVMLAPLTKLNSSLGRIRKIKTFGGVRYIWITSASKCGFPFGFPCASIYYKRDYKGNIEVEIDN